MKIELDKREIEIILRALKEELGFLRDSSLISDDKDIQREMELIKNIISMLRFSGRKNK